MSTALAGIIVADIECKASVSVGRVFSIDAVISNNDSPY